MTYRREKASYSHAGSHKKNDMASTMKMAQYTMMIRLGMHMEWPASKEAAIRREFNGERLDGFCHGL
jgi:hypothetical protein